MSRPITKLDRMYSTFEQSLSWSDADDLIRCRAAFEKQVDEAEVEAVADMFRRCASAVTRELKRRVQRDAAAATAAEWEYYPA